MGIILIDEFLQRYSREYDFYNNLARICASQCEIGLESNGIRSIVTYRVKRVERLRNKLIKRNSETEYKNIESIYQDIVDLAGVRIALYFPSDREEVEKFINTNFEVVQKKTFPSSAIPSYNKRFSGYWATHYRVFIKNETLKADSKRYEQTIIEIQVASILMHAWSEVEHDLVYKPLSGQLSEDEYAILDELNGLVLSGEIALERLQKASKIRIKNNSEYEVFSNHYELSSYIYDFIKPAFQKSGDEPLMGKVDIFYKFLDIVKINTPTMLNKYMENWDVNIKDRPIVDQLFDRISSGNPEFYSIYQNLKEHAAQVASGEEIHEAIISSLGYFLSRWITYEKVINIIFKDTINPMFLQNTMISSIKLKELNIFDDNTIDEINYIRKVRNEVVHGIEKPNGESLISFGRAIERVLSIISTNNLGEEKNNEIRNIINEMPIFIE